MTDIDMIDMTIEENLTMIKILITMIEKEKMIDIQDMMIIEEIKDSKLWFSL